MLICIGNDCKHEGNKRGRISIFDKTKIKSCVATALNFENKAREKELEIFRNKMHRDFKKKYLQR